MEMEASKILIIATVVDPMSICSHEKIQQKITIIKVIFQMSYGIVVEQFTIASTHIPLLYIHACKHAHNPPSSPPSRSTAPFIRPPGSHIIVFKAFWHHSTQPKLEKPVNIYVWNMSFRSPVTVLGSTAFRVL